MDLGFLTALGGVQAIPFAGLFTLMVYGLLSGKLVFARDRDDRLAEKDAEIARNNAAHEAELQRAFQERDDWKAAWRESQDIGAEVRSQNRDLVDSLYFVRKIVGALPRSEGGENT